MAKGRWYRRRPTGPSGSPEGPGGPGQPESDDLAGRLEALGDEVRRARADAAERAARLDRPAEGLAAAGRTGRRRWAVLGAVVLIIVGVLVGLEASSSGHHTSQPLLTATTATTTTPTTTVPAVTTLAPNPTTAPVATTGPVATTVPPRTSVSPTTTLPSTTAPSGGSGAAAPPGPTVPPSSVPPSMVAPSVVVRPGDSLWSIATAAVRARLGAAPTPMQIGPYWVRLIAANTARLPFPRRPDLIYPGMMVILPPAG